METARSNLFGTFNLLDVYSARDIHVTTVGTGILHKYDAHHRLDNDQAYTEEDAPTFAGNVYVRLRILEEKILQDLFPEKYLLLRIQYPISSDMHPRQ